MQAQRGNGHARVQCPVPTTLECGGIHGIVGISLGHRWQEHRIVGIRER